MQVGEQHTLKATLKARQGGTALPGSQQVPPLLLPVANQLVTFRLQRHGVDPGLSNTGSVSGPGILPRHSVSVETILGTAHTNANGVASINYTLAEPGSSVFVWAEFTNSEGDRWETEHVHHAVVSEQAAGGGFTGIAILPRFQEPRTGGAANLTATVHDDKQQPVKGARVHFTFWRFNTDCDECGFGRGLDEVFGPNFQSLAMAADNGAAHDKANDVIVRWADTDAHGVANMSLESSTPGQVIAMAALDSSEDGKLMVSQPAMINWVDSAPLHRTPALIAAEEAQHQDEIQDKQHAHQNGHTKQQLGHPRKGGKHNKHQPPKSRKH